MTPGAASIASAYSRVTSFAHHGTGGRRHSPASASDLSRLRPRRYKHERYDARDQAGSFGHPERSVDDPAAGIGQRGTTPMRERALGPQSGHRDREQHGDHGGPRGRGPIGHVRLRSLPRK